LGGCLLAAYPPCSWAQTQPVFALLQHAGHLETCSMNEPGPKAAIKAAWITGAFALVAAFVGLLLPVVEKWVDKAESTAVITVVLPTVLQPATDLPAATPQVPPEASPIPPHLPSPASTSDQASAQAKASIESPQDDSAVGENVTVTGTIFDLRPGQRAFLCIKSRAFSRLIYPQEEIIPDTSGHWTARGVYRTPGYEYETYVVVTDNPDSAEALTDRNYRANGMPNLPRDTSIVSPVIVVVRY